MKNNQKVRSINRVVTGALAVEPDDVLRNDDSRQLIADLRERLKLQELISGISAKFVNLPAEKVDSEIENGLKYILEFMDLDRCTFAEFSHDRKSLFVTHTIQKPGIEIPSKEIVESLPWFGAQLLKGRVSAIAKPSDLPAAAVAERTYCERTGLKSDLSIPISIGGALISAIAFTTYHHFHPWPKDTIEQLRVLGEVFANAIYRKRAEDENRKHLQDIRIQYEFERLISGLSAEFVKLKTTDVGRSIEASQKRLVEFLEVNRSMLFRVSADRTELLPVAAYSVEGIDRLGEIPVGSWFPWAAKKILEGGVISFSSPDQLPPEADIDRSNLGLIKLKAAVMVPIFLDGSVEYALSVGCVRQSHKWSDDIAARLQLVGEIFVNALIRSKNLEIMQKHENELKTAYKKITKISEQLKRENRYYHDEISAVFHSTQIIGISSGLKYIFYRLKQVAQTDATVLIQGETGTGKELVARALHEYSNRKDQPLIKIDCASLHDSVIESELFGHEKGAYTSANARRIGRIELADNATILLDEVGEIPLTLQDKILRVIESGEFERLGSSNTRKVNMRVIAATNRNLNDEVKKGKFREDLFYRLNVFPLTLPPLRERKEDISVLAEWFIERFNKQTGKRITQIPGGAKKALQNYAWPGNVRELKNIIERAMIISEGPELKLMEILAVQNSPDPFPVAGKSLQELEMNYIRRILEESY